MANIKIDKEYMESECLTKGAQEELEKKVEDYMITVVSQAGLSESRSREGSTPEITASHISEADWMCRRGLIKNKINKKIIIYRVLQLIGSFIIGIGASNITNTLGIIATVVGIALGVITYVLELEENRAS